jgi:HprK-related kinase A
VNTIAALPSRELRRRLASQGLLIRLGPVVFRIRSPFPAVASAVQFHYGEYDTGDTEDFVDFDICVTATGGFRRFVRRQVIFDFEGHRPFHPLPVAQAHPLLEWGLNWCIAANCHQYLIVHAGVVERAGRAMLLPARAGSGKSTLCAGLVACGWRLLSDELALIDMTSRSIVPIPRPISLKNASIDVVATAWKDSRISPPVADTTKGRVAYVSVPSQSIRRAHEPAALGWIVAPSFRDGADTELAPMPRADAFMHVVDNAINYSVHGREGFLVVADLVDGAECFRFSYGGRLDDAAQCLDALATGQQ